MTNRLLWWLLLLLLLLLLPLLLLLVLLVWRWLWRWRRRRRRLWCMQEIKSNTTFSPVEIPRTANASLSANVSKVVSTNYSCGEIPGTHCRMVSFLIRSLCVCLCLRQCQWIFSSRSHTHCPPPPRLGGFAV